MRAPQDTEAADELPTVYFDTLVGSDSHTPTANGIGVLGWGVGGIEAEAAALGQPITTLVPRVVGVRLTGALQPGVTAMDVALAFAQTLRAKGVVGCFVECFGEGLASLTATQRTCISNMTPEYGCTCTLFPVDGRTLEYLRLTGKDAEQVALVEAYAKAQGFWHDLDAPERTYADVVELDLSTVTRSIAGPSRPHDRIGLCEAQERFHAVCAERGLDLTREVHVQVDGQECALTHGALAIAAVTSCTTATDPSMMVAAGLVARNAAARGLRPRPWVKTILAPGSHATESFCWSGRGSWTVCASWDSIRAVSAAWLHRQFRARAGHPASGGERHRTGERPFRQPQLRRPHFPDVAQNYLAAPAVVVAYALAGTMDVDLEHDALGRDAQGRPVHLADIWPSDDEVAALVTEHVTDDLYATGTRDLFVGDAAWEALGAEPSDVFSWDDRSTYVRRPPYFDGMGRCPDAPVPIEGARVLALLGDFITTDHISPAGSIAADSPAARYLQEHGVALADFNTYGSRRGNHEVMMRGTFANVKLANLLAAGRKGGWTRDFLSGDVRPLYDASEHYAQERVPLVVVAGKMYGSGSSRDWAAKGPALLGIRGVLAESFERIHRSNLIGMGILPLQFRDGENAETLGLDGSERFTVEPVDFSQGLPEPSVARVTAEKEDGSRVEFQAVVRVDTPTEGRYFLHGGILPYVLRQLLGLSA